MNTKTALQFAKEFDVSDIRSDARAILEAFENARDDQDFTVNFGRIEYRFIHDDAIERIHRAEIEDLVDDCYSLDRVRGDLGSVGQYLMFDYDALARDARISDGYGHHFAGYDGEEIENGAWHAFRVD